MRLAIISDIHSNLEALTSVMADIDSSDIDRIVCLGDIVGYGANPVECLAIVRERAQHAVLGNHDAAVYDRPLRELFNVNAKISAVWTERQLAAEGIAWLKSLPYRIAFDNILFVHSAPSSPELWNYVVFTMEARMYAAAFTERLCFLGHSHVAIVHSLDPAVREYDGFNRFIVNPGSVGQPRDGNPLASYGVLDTVAGTYENRRVEYDIRGAAAAIRRVGLPVRLAERLFQGR